MCIFSHDIWQSNNLSLLPCISTVSVQWHKRNIFQWGQSHFSRSFHGREICFFPLKIVHFGWPQSGFKKRKAKGKKRALCAHLYNFPFHFQFSTSYLSIFFKFSFFALFSRWKMSGRHSAPPAHPTPACYTTVSAATSLIFTAPTLQWNGGLSGVKTKLIICHAGNHVHVIVSKIYANIW